MSVMGTVHHRISMMISMIPLATRRAHETTRTSDRQEP